jgi:hypothetical protein
MWSETMRNQFLKLLTATILMLVATGAAQATETTFNAPMWNGDRLDWCRDWSIGCGKAAADTYCKTRGCANALAFQQAANIGGSQRTRLIGTGAVCAQSFCDSSKSIT